jgi:hypothetical protein
MKTVLATTVALLGLAGALRAVELAADDFDFGLTVRGREKVIPGTFLGGQITPVGHVRWQTPPVEREHGSRYTTVHLVFTDADGGDDHGLVSHAPQYGIASGFLTLDLASLKAPVTASVEFLANDSFQRPGGIWVGFTADSPSYLDIIDGRADHIALRFTTDATNEGNRKLSYQVNLSGTDSVKWSGKSLKAWTPTEVTRLSLTYDPASRQFVGKVELVNRPDVEPVEISGTLESDTIFNNVQFDMTGMDALSQRLKRAVFRRISVSSGK